ncbi:hypothetical protein ACHAXT_012432 [Thalassiosira profunda]
MNAEDLYTREDLMTPEELEDFHLDPSDCAIPTLTPLLKNWILMGAIGDDSDSFMHPAPEAETREEFERRPPALGANPRLLRGLEAHYEILPPVQQRSMYRLVRSQMLRQLISCDGAATLPDLVGILRREMEAGTPSPVPEWYEFSTVRMGPRKIGYDGCSNRGCLRTESCDKPRFARCSKCKVAVYHSRECQIEDWKARHKQVCKQAKKEREQIARAGAAMQAFSAGFGGAGF